MTPPAPHLLVGVSEPSGWQAEAVVEEVDAGRAHGAMLSASALWRRDRGWREPPATLPPEPWQVDLAAELGVEPQGQRLPDVVATALDSAGFTAMRHHGGFPWVLRDYLDLACAYPWIWYSQPDLCCEPEIAADRQEVEDRVGRSAGLLGRCYRLIDAWREQGVVVEDPVPVLQGWRPDDYLLSLECINRVCILFDRPLPSFLGLGSVCRRAVGGDDGLVAVLSRLDAELPAGVRLHLFGVKSEALEAVGGWGRVASVDSMAWQSASRWSAAKARQKASEALGRPVRPGDPEWVPDDQGRKRAHLKAFIARQTTTPAQLSLVPLTHDPQALEAL